MSDAHPVLLYVDRDPALARLAARSLRRRGYAVEHATDDESALLRLRLGGIDVVALNRDSSARSTLATLARIRRMPVAPPVILVASQDSRVAVTALKAGAADYIVKDAQGDFIALLGVAASGALTRERMRREKEAAEAEVREARDRFAALAAEQEVLLREVNHRVGNSLQIIASLLHLQAASSDDDNIKAALTNAMGRVAAVAQVHRRLYTSNDFKSVMLDQYLASLIEDLRRSAGGERLTQLTLKAEPVELEPDRAVAVGMIVNELVMNAVKYAYPEGSGPIEVELTPTSDDALRLTISDKGVGFGAMSQDHNSTGLGQRIVNAMASKIDARIRYLSEGGTRVIVDFHRRSADRPSPLAAAS